MNVLFSIINEKRNVVSLLFKNYIYIHTKKVYIKLGLGEKERKVQIRFAISLLRKESFYF
jgi:hypothetical protein